MSGTVPHSRGCLRMAAIVILPLLAAAAVLGAGLYGRFFQPHSLPVRDSDRPMLVTIGDLEPSLTRFTPRTDAESLVKTRHVDGRVELRYEYLHPDLDRTLYVRSVVEVYPSRQAAEQVYYLLLRNPTQVPFDGVKLTDSTMALPWAKEARLAVLSQNGKPRGHCFLCVEQDRLFQVEIFGLHFDNDQVFQDLIFSRLELLAGYRP